MIVGNSLKGFINNVSLIFALFCQITFIDADGICFIEQGEKNTLLVNFLAMRAVGCSVCID